MSKRDRQSKFAGWDAAEESPSNQADDADFTEVSPVEIVPPAIEEGGLSELRGKTIYIIDAHSLIYQVFHALPPMTSPHGEAVGAVYGFTRDLVFLLEEKKPDYLFCAFDMPGKTFRHELYDRYKETRDEMPVDLRSQIPLIRQVIDAMGIPALGVEGYEADDLLATVARISDASGARCFLVTGDKDCRQLLTDRVKIFNIRKNQVYDEQALLADWGVTPEQVVDFQSLVGDSTDNVPGIPLIGPKVAQQLLAAYGSLEGVLDHAGEVSGAKRKENLLNGRETALMCRELVRLKDDVPVDIDWNAGQVGGLNSERARDLFHQLGFRGLAERVLSSAPDAATSTAAKWETNYQTVDTVEALQRLVDQLLQQSLVSIDLETTHIWPRWAEIVGYALAVAPGEAFYVPVRGPADDRCIEPATALELLRPFFESAAVQKIGQNLKYDLIVLRNVGVDVAGVSFDTMIASYLLEAGERNHNLDELAKRYLDHETVKISSLIGTGKNQKRMDEVPVAAVAHYAAEDADVPVRIHPVLAERLEQEKLRELFDELEMPLIDVLVELESNGIRVDVARLKSLSDDYGARLAVIEREIYELAGREFNIASPKQLAQILFEEQGLPIVKKTKTGASTDAEVLEELAVQHPLPAKIIEHRQYAKLRNTYLDALPTMVNPNTGRVHASFNQVVAATGRLSCGDPNLQNIPIRTQAGREIRSAFLPGEDDWLLVAADYSQIELRVLAHFCGDAALRQAFIDDEDIHALVASQVYDVPQSEVTAEMRRNAKAVNFGVIYGQSAFGLAKQLHIPQDEAARFIEAYFAKYSQVDDFLTEVLDACRVNGFVRTISGRKRSIRGIRENPPQRQRNMAERTAINTVIQGSAADLIKLAMINIYRRLKSEPWRARMLLQIHDELVFEAPPEEVDRLIPLIREEMSTAHELDVPLKVDVKTGKNWAEVEPWS